MKNAFVLITILICSTSQAAWTNITSTAYSYKGEDPGPAAISACNARVTNYMKSCKNVGKVPSVFSACRILGYFQGPYAATAATAVQCN